MAGRPHSTVAAEPPSATLSRRSGRDSASVEASRLAFPWRWTRLSRSRGENISGGRKYLAPLLASFSHHFGWPAPPLRHPPRPVVAPCRSPRRAVATRAPSSPRLSGRPGSAIKNLTQSAPLARRALPSLLPTAISQRFRPPSRAARRIRRFSGEAPPLPRPELGRQGSRTRASFLGLNEFVGLQLF